MVPFGVSAVLCIGFSSYFRRKPRHNLEPFFFSLPHDLQILAIFLSLEHSGTLCLMVLFGGSDVLSIGFSS